MISAKEALELYNISLHTLQKYLYENFHSQIRQASMAGKREYKHNIGSTDSHFVPSVSNLEVKVIEELRKYGYIVDLRFYGDSYVPRGLADDDGNGPIYKNYGIMVKW